MEIGNTRLWEAIVALITGEGDARKRVAVACQILDKMSPAELPEHLDIRLKNILAEAGKYGPKIGRDGTVMLDCYENTSGKRTNRTYARLARQIYDVYFDSTVATRNCQ